MSFTIDVRTNLNKIASCMENWEKAQLPFAINLTLNTIALLSQQTICKNIPLIFNNNSKWWDRRQKTGVRVQFASKYVLVSAVYTKAHFAYIQEEGGIKRPHTGTNLAVPTDNVPRRQRSSKALRTEKANTRIFKAGKSIYNRVSSKRLKRLYSLAPQAHVKARFGFKRIAMKVFNRQFDRVFTEKFNYALSTMH